MKAKIDHNGHLWLERGGVMKKQECPYYIATYCGDACPLFGEPRDWEGVPQAHIKPSVALLLCNNMRWDFANSDFTDERGNKE